MSDELPMALVPPDVDLRDFPYMPLYLARLQKSKTWLRCKRQPELAFYMLNLWMRAWHETPAGSIEDDDDVLADAAMCDLRKWPRIKDAVMQGWERGADGRFYHAVVAELAIEAWSVRQAQRQRTEAARQARLQAKSQSQSSGTAESVTSSVTESVTCSKGREGKGSRREEEKELPDGSSKKRASRLPSDFIVPHEWRGKAAAARERNGLPAVNLNLEAEKFVLFWTAKSGQAGTKLDWERTWINWALNAKGVPVAAAGATERKPKAMVAGSAEWLAHQREMDAEVERAMNRPAGAQH